MHPDIIEFMTLCEQVQTSIKGEPSRISLLWNNDKKFAEVCRRINHLAFFLDFRIRDSGDTVLENVNPGFIEKWRHYKNNLAPHLGKLTADELLKGLGLATEEGPAHELSAVDLEEWDIQDAKEQSDNLELRIELGSFDRLSGTLEQEITDKVWDGERALDRLRESLNLDFFGILYRQKQLTTIHIPTPASSRDSGRFLSIANIIKEAHRAYILGLPIATIALCRTASETIIRDHYKIGDPKSKNFTKRFRDAAEDRYAKEKGADDELLKFILWASNISHGRTGIDSLPTYADTKDIPLDVDMMSRVAFRWLEKLVKLTEGIK